MSYGTVYIVPYDTFIVQRYATAYCDSNGGFECTDCLVQAEGCQGDTYLSSCSYGSIACSTCPMGSVRDTAKWPSAAPGVYACRCIPGYVSKYVGAYNGTWVEALGIDHFVWGSLYQKDSSYGQNVYPPSAPCEACPGGKYSNATYATQCYDCPANFGSAGAAATACVVCPNAYYSGVGEACLPCAPGTRGNGAGLGCVGCPANYGGGGYNSTACVACPYGHSSEVGGACQACPSGKYASGSIIGCLDCPASYGGSPPGSSSCAQCGAGNYSEVGGACLPCPRGKYNDGTVAGCLDCPVNTGGAGPGATSCSSCPANTYSGPGAGCQGYVLSCPSVTFSLSPGTGLICCSGQGWTWSIGSYPPTACPAGKHSNALNEACLPCAANSYSYAGSSSCTSCGVDEVVVGFSCVFSCVHGFTIDRYDPGGGTCVQGSLSSCTPSQYVSMTAYGSTDVQCASMSSGQAAVDYPVTTDRIAAWVEEGACMKAFSSAYTSLALSSSTLVEDISGVMLYSCSCNAGFYVAYGPLGGLPNGIIADAGALGYS
eukprot:145786-Hanusia_phi.AAC.1